MFIIALKNVLRNRRNPLLMVFAIALSIGFLLGTNYAATTIATSFVQYKTKQVPVDYVFSTDSEKLNHIPDFRKVKESILTVENVTDVKVVWMRSVTCFFVKNVYPINDTERLEIIQNGTAKDITIDVFGIIPEFVESTEDIIWIKGSMTNATNEVAIPEGFAHKENLDIGDTISLIQYKSRYLGTTTYKNLTISGIYRLVGNLRRIFIEIEMHAPIFLTSIDTLKDIYTRLSTSGFISHIYYSSWEIIQGYPRDAKLDFYIYVFFNREKITNVWDPEQSRSKAASISIKVYEKIQATLDFSKSGIIPERSVTPLVWCYDDVYSWIFGSRIFFGLMYFFLFVLMLEFTKAITYMYKSHRMRELGLLLIKGISLEQITRLFIYEGIIIGVLGLFGGILISYLVNWYFANSVAEILGINKVGFWFTQPSFSDWIIAILLVCFYIYLMINVLKKDLAAVTPMEVLQTAEEKSPEIISRKDKVIYYILIFGFLASGLKLIALALRIDVNKALGDIFNATGPFFMLWFVFLIIALTDYALWFFGNVVFIYCTMKLVSLKINTFSKYLKVIIRKIMGDFSSITIPRISKTVVKYARVGFVIGLVVSIGTASAIARATAIDFNSRIAKVSVGADINIEAYSMNIDMLDNLTKVTGVNNFTYIFSAPADEFIFGTIYMQVVFINPEKYLEIAKRYIEEDYTRNGMFKALVEMEKNKSYVLINERASIETPASIGDTITLWVSVNNMVSKFNCHVLDLIDALPGFPELSHKRHTDYPVRGSYYIQEPYIVINKALIDDYINEYNISLTEMIDSRVKILVDVEEGYNQTRVAEKISQQYDVIKITTAEEAINKANINPTVLSDVEYLWLEYQIMLLIATLGIVVSMISIVESRKREFGMLVARGATTQQLIKLMLSEFLAILLITIPIGVLTGIPSVYAVLPQIQFLQTTTTVPIKLTISQEFIYVAILSALSIIAGILGAVYMIEKEKVVEVIRFE